MMLTAEFRPLYIHPSVPDIYRIVTSAGDYYACGRELTMTVYRVFEAYHVASESGTIEYGTFSSRARAEARLAAVWAQKKYPPPTSQREAGWFGRGTLDYYAIEIETVEVDEETETERVGYT